jgi:hypothetical protein
MVRRRRLRHHDPSEAGGALDLAAARAGVGGNMLAADRARKFEFAHRFHRNNSTSGRQRQCFFGSDFQSGASHIQRERSA